MNEIIIEGERKRVIPRDNDGLKHGTCLMYQRGNGDDWRLIVSTEFEHGVLHGDHIVYHDNAELSLRIRYRKGQPVIWEEFNTNGKLHGKTFTYYANGEINECAVYVNGRLVGLYNDQGQDIMGSGAVG